MQIFKPGPDTGRAFREALGRFATGVTVVTVRGETTPLGITVNSFASVSLDPPLVLWCPARASARFPVFAHASHFAIHVLGAEQEEICRHFARNSTAQNGMSWAENAQGVPCLPDALARFDCAAHAVHEGGDHAIIVGHVLEARMRVGAPLVFSTGRFGGFAPAPFPL